MSAISSEIERLRAENERQAERIATLEALTTTPLWSHRALTAKLHEIIATRFGVRFMDPPDGGDVSAHEQVERMADALLAAEVRAASAEAERDEALNCPPGYVEATNAIIEGLTTQRDALAAKLAVMDVALEPFAKAAGVIAWTEKVTGRVFDDAAPFRSGLAWRESEECRHLTYGHFRRARSASAAARGETR